MRVLVNNDTIQVTCSGCRSVLAVCSSDIIVNDIGHGHQYPQWVICPVCNRSVEIPLANIPLRWRSIIFSDN